MVRGKKEDVKGSGYLAEDGLPNGMKDRDRSPLQFIPITSLRAHIFFAFPEIVLAMALAGIMGPGTATMIFALSVTAWMRYARVVRAIALKTKQRDYVKAAKLFQVSGIRIIFRHILPPALPAVSALITLGMAKSVLAVSALGFLGFGVSPPSPEWGTLLLDGKDYILSAPHLAFFPGMVIFVTVFALNIFGDRLAQSKLFMSAPYDS